MSCRHFAIDESSRIRRRQCVTADDWRKKRQPDSILLLLLLLLCRASRLTHFGDVDITEQRRPRAGTS